VGLDIPNAEQVAKLQSQMTWWNPKSRKISEAWEEMRLNIFADVARKQTYLNNKEKWLSKGTKSPLHGKQSSLEPEQSEALRASPSSSATSKKLRAPPRSPRSPRDKQVCGFVVASFLATFKIFLVPRLYLFLIDGTRKSC